MTDNSGEIRRICTLERSCVAVQHLPDCKSQGGNYTPTLETVLAKLERPGAFFTAEEVRIVLDAREGQTDTSSGTSGVGSEQSSPCAGES